jgi:hypothetical protein
MPHLKSASNFHAAQLFLRGLAFEIVIVLFVGAKLIESPFAPTNRTMTISNAMRRESRRSKISVLHCVIDNTESIASKTIANF